MISPNYMCELSLVSNKTKIMGNIELAGEIEKITKECIKEGKDLYNTQEQIENLLIKKFGIAWYNKSGAAVNFIIENEYAHLERSYLPAFDMEQYKKDIETGVLY